MTENELRQLETLVKKYRHAFAWQLTHTKKDIYEQTSDALIRQIRQIIAHGGTYNDKDFLVKGTA